MVGLGWGTGCGQLLPWVLKKKGTGFYLPRKASLGGMEVKTIFLLHSLACLGSASPLSHESFPVWYCGLPAVHSADGKVISSVTS